ncbi:MAG: DUF4445 domain-containing protein [Rhodospirillaceae bacterium]|nr:DUF4445 domain-containing protein [Rhodospirillaceae bacterium]
MNIDTKAVSEAEDESGSNSGLSVRVPVLPMDQVIELSAGDTILDVARRERIRIASSCGGHGTCITCAIQVTDGEIPEPHDADRQVFSERRIEDGWRRACLTRPVADCTILVPPRSTAAAVRTQVDGQAGEVEFAPGIEVLHFELEAPTLEDFRADDLRIQEAFPGKADRFDARLLAGFAEDVRRWKWRGWLASRDGEIVAAGPIDAPVLGLAVDLGTTNMSGFLIDMQSGEVLATEGLENPQTMFGGDLITYASHIRRNPEMADELRKLAVEGVNRLAGDLCDAIDAAPEQIVEVTVAGNTMMHHLLLGLPVKQLALSPFISALSAAADFKARDLGLMIAPGAYVHMLANIAGFVGGDHVATLLASEIDVEKPVIIMDIGTNTEISLVQAGNITSVSCPSGPAFEGGNISAGMRAAVGAIELVRIKGDELSLKVIGDAAPVGLCGSGVLDVVAQLYLAGVCDNRGRLREEHSRVRLINEKRAFVLADEEASGSGAAIVFTQDDIRNLQLAKAAIRAATDILLDECGYTEADLGKVVIAGAFGNYIDVASALAIGMLPDLPFNRFAQVGNAAGDGARFTLQSKAQRQLAVDIAARAQYFELASAPTFMKVFGKRMNFTETTNIKNKD